MITQQSLQQCALTPFPWGGTSAERKELKGKPLLTVLFKNPSYFMWAYKQAIKQGLPLAGKMTLLLRAIATIEPTATCKQGNPIKYWSLYKGIINDAYRMCEDEDCECHHTGASSNFLVRHTFLALKDELSADRDPSTYLRAFKADYGLPSRYNETTYLKWLLDNADLSQLS